MIELWLDEDLFVFIFVNRYEKGVHIYFHYIFLEKNNKFMKIIVSDIRKIFTSKNKKNKTTQTTNEATAVTFYK